MAQWAATNAKRNVFFNDYIANDARFSVSPTTSVANLAESCREIKQVYPNATAVVGTMLSLGGFDSAKDTVNPLIRQMATDGQSGCDGFIDMASDPVLGAGGASANSLYFNSDEVRPTDAGYSEMDEIITRYINSLDGSSSESPTIVTANAYTMTTADNFVRWTPTTLATGILPECIGMLGTATRGVFTIENASVANMITMSGLGSETISGSVTIGENETARFKVQPNIDAVACCNWVWQ
jgi:trimeric autotransporter adhesin